MLSAQYLPYTNYVFYTKYVLLPTEQIDTCKFVNTYRLFQEINYTCLLTRLIDFARHVLTKQRLSAFRSNDNISASPSGRPLPTLS